MKEREIDYPVRCPKCGGLCHDLDAGCSCGWMPYDVVAGGIIDVETIRRAERVAMERLAKAMNATGD